MNGGTPCFVRINYFWTSEILLLTIIFYLWRQMGGIITPFVGVVKHYNDSLSFRWFLYYLTNPIVNFYKRNYFKINRIIGILLTLCLGLGASYWGSLSLTDFD